MTLRPRRGRPLGAVARAFLEAVHVRPRTVRAIAADLQLHYPTARRLACELRDAGHVAFSAATEPTATRPAGVLVPAAPAAQQPLFRGDELAGVFGLMIRTGRD